MKYRAVLFLWMFAFTCAHSQTSTPQGHLDAVREQITLMSGLLSTGERPAQPSVERLRLALRLLRARDSSDSATTSPLARRGSTATRTLDAALDRCSELAREDLSVDSLRSIFRAIAEGFEFTFCDYFEAQALASHGRKALLFSISISCDCTLKLCGDHLDALYALARRRGDRVRIAVIDSFRRPDLKERYSIEFEPTLVILDENNREILREVREALDSERITRIIE